MTTIVSIAALLLGAAGLALALSASRRLAVAEDRLRQIFDPLGIGPDIPEPGTAVPVFEAVTTAGERIVSTDLVDEEVLLVFLSASCESCRWDLPRLETALADLATRGPRPIVVLAGNLERRGEIRDDLTVVARVVDDDAESTLTKSFGVRGYPSLIKVRGGVVVQSGHTIGELALAAPG